MTTTSLTDTLTAGKAETRYHFKKGRPLFPQEDEHTPYEVVVMTAAEHEASLAVVGQIRSEAQAIADANAKWDTPTLWHARRILALTGDTEEAT